MLPACDCEALCAFGSAAHDTRNECNTHTDSGSTDTYPRLTAAAVARALRCMAAARGHALRVSPDGCRVTVERVACVLLGVLDEKVCRRADLLPPAAQAIRFVADGNLGAHSGQMRCTSGSISIRARRRDAEELAIAQVPTRLSRVLVRSCATSTLRPMSLAQSSLVATGGQGA
eukprot:4001111-Prymnesium_polylepis.1